MSQRERAHPANRADAISTVIAAYLDLPDTPDEASPRDFRIATALIDDRVNIDHILRAIKIGFVRRWARDHSAGRLPPIRSLAYFQTVLEGLSDNELSDDYGLYVDYMYARIRPNPQAWLDQQTPSINKASHAHPIPLLENRAR